VERKDRGGSKRLLVLRRERGGGGGGEGESGCWWMGVVCVVRWIWILRVGW